MNETTHEQNRPEKRKMELLVLSDVHLGTIGCHAQALCDYLDSVDPEKIILNGDFVDCWQFKKYYWPKAHMQVLRKVMKFVTKGVPVYYVTGNHDEVLRRFSDVHLGDFHLVDKLVLDLDGRKAWIFHGDIFDVVMKHSRLLVKLGSVGYDLLILINKVANFALSKLGKGKISLSKKIKDSVKSAVNFIGDFEATAAGLAVENGYDYVVCGHIHRPEIRRIEQEGGSVTYLNSGDWIENLTSLEYANGAWTLYRHQEVPLTRPAYEPAEEDDLEAAFSVEALILEAVR